MRCKAKCNNLEADGDRLLMKSYWLVVYLLDKIFITFLLIYCQSYKSSCLYTESLYPCYISFLLKESVCFWMLFLMSQRRQYSHFPFFHFPIKVQLLQNLWLFKIMGNILIKWFKGVKSHSVQKKKKKKWNQLYHQS